MVTDLRRRYLTILLVVLLAPRGAAAQQPERPRVTAQGVLVDFQDVDIAVVISALAEAGNLNVSFGELPARRITLRLRRPVPTDSIPALLRSLAEANGVRVVDASGMMRFESDVPAASRPAPAAARQDTSAGLRLYVYRLRHARAVMLAATLQSIFGGGSIGPPSDELSHQPLSQQLRGQQVPRVNPDTIGRGPRIDVSVAGASIPAQLRGAVQIVPDEGTNSLLVRASPPDWEVIRQAIESVDLRPLQVLIEVVIAEVRRSSDLEVGVSGSVSHTPPGATQPDQSATLQSDVEGDLLLKWMQGGRVDVQVAISALAAHGDVRILSRPVILAQNNQEARIMIGSQRPFIQVFRSLPTDAGVRDQIVQYRDVGTSLTIVPTINPDGYVNLQLLQEVSSATTETQFGAPVISTREASTYLFVRDGQTAVIGGLVDRERDRNRSGIPVLIRIPVLGALFGTTRNSTSTSELFLFLTPHIIQSDADLDRVRRGVQRGLPLLQPDLKGTKPLVPPPEPPEGSP